MRLEYTLSKADWIALADHYVATAPAYRRSIMSARLITPVAAVLMLLALERDRVSGLSIAAAALAALAIGWFAVPYGIRSSVRSHMLRQSRVCHEGPHVLELRTAGLYSFCARGESTLAWIAVDSVAETPTHVFVMLGEAFGFAIPRAGVTSGDLATFAADLRKHIVRPDGA